MTCLVDRVLSGAGELFCTHLGTKYANFKEKIFVEIYGKKFQTFHCSNVTTMKSLGIFSRNLRRDFFLKISIFSVKVYTKKVPNIKECNFIHLPLRLLTTKQVIVVLYLQGVQLYETVCKSYFLKMYGHVQQGVSFYILVCQKSSDACSIVHADAFGHK